MCRVTDVGVSVVHDVAVKMIYLSILEVWPLVS
jgi:hypothetical protein